MTRDDIIRMAREAELIRDDSTASRWLPGTDLYPELNAFAALVAAAEREACAKVCDDLLANPHTGGGWSDAMIEAAAAMRARGDQ